MWPHHGSELTPSAVSQSKIFQGSIHPNHQNTFSHFAVVVSSYADSFDFIFSFHLHSSRMKMNGV